MRILESFGDRADEGILTTRMLRPRAVVASGVDSTIYSVGDFDTDYGYTGELTDGTGLINLRARYYDPGTGRFITKDTWGGDYQMPTTLVRWLYANSNPVRYADPSGNMSISECYALNICKDKHMATVFSYLNGEIVEETVCDDPPNNYYYDLPDKYPVETLSTSEAGYTFIKEAETFPYRDWERWPYGDLGDLQGTCTIGYGTVLSSPDITNCNYERVISQGVKYVTANVTGITKPLFDSQGLMNGLSQSDAEDLLEAHIRLICEKNMNADIPGVYLTQNEYDALISYMYNGGNVTDLADDLIAYNTGEVAKAMLGNNYIEGGTPLDALNSRRAKEVKLFLNGEYTYR